MKKWFGTPTDLVFGDPFTVYAGVKCDLVTLPEDKARMRAERKFDFVESRQVDYHMARLISEHGNDLGDCPLSQMVMNAEYAQVLEYGSYPTIAMSGPLAVCAASQRLIFPCPPDQCVTATDMWRTVGGTYVTQIAQNDVISAKNFFLTGRVTLIRGPKQTVIAPAVGDNTNYALTERVYVPLIECMAYFGTATCDAPVTP